MYVDWGDLGRLTSAADTLGEMGGDSIYIY